MKIKTGLLLLVMLPLACFCQRITYSVPENDDSRSVDFEVIGKVNNNFLVYKNIRNRFAVSVYDNDMKLKERVPLDFIPEKTINVDFIAYPDFAYIIYQYQRRSILRCMAAKIDGNGHKIGEPVELDTTFINVFADNKIYSTINSEDKQQVMIYKIQKKNDRFFFTTILFNAQLGLLHKSRLIMPYDDRKDIFSDFLVDNEGNFVFTKSTKVSARDLIDKASMVTKAPLSDDFESNDINLDNNFLDEVKLKIDNVNKHYILSSYYYKQKHGNIDGLYTGIWDKNSRKQLAAHSFLFTDAQKQEAKTDGSTKIAFNDFFIRQIILKKDGGFILTGEDYYTQSHSSPWNRMDYLYGYPYMSSYDYYLYSPSGYWYNYRPRSFSGNGQTRYYYENISVMNVDKDGNLLWSNVIRKSQYDDDTDNFLSFAIMNEGGELHYLFNELERRYQLIDDQTITPDGKITRNPTLKSLDKGYEFMPRFAKQVSAKQIIVPCTFRNYICFAKIDY
ncbi:MAG: hypothetical protein H0W12_11300 [Chitinophagaceae bacterium]|nr:hypothetical protein [Chitinophagaceae bacterium]